MSEELKEIDLDKENKTEQELEKREKKPKKNRQWWNIIRASLIAFIAFSVICGLLYTVSVTIFAQSLFPYESNGSVIEITIDGTRRIYGSELIGQSYIKLDNNGQPVLEDEEGNYYLTGPDAETYYLDESNNFELEDGEIMDTNKLNTEITTTYVVYQTQYFIGRNNSGAPSNASPLSDVYLEDIETRKEALIQSGYNENYNNLLGVEGIPSEMVTESGSGCDPEISYDTAMYQVKMVAKSRGMSEDEAIQIVDKYTKKPFFGIFGAKRVNVLLVNLALDGLL